MQIVNSAIQLASTHTAIQYQERQESLTVWKNGKEANRVERKNDKEHSLQHQAEKLAKEAAKVSLSQTAQQRATEVSEASETAGPGEEEKLIGRFFVLDCGGHLEGGAEGLFFCLFELLSCTEEMGKPLFFFL